MLTFCKKNIVILSIILIITLLTFCYSEIVYLSVSRFNGLTIVLDAGHGGRDGGAVGVNGTIEKEINLEYVLLLKEKLVSNGYRVELTRKNDDGLYSLLDKNKKSSDMKARMKIIKKANPNLVISIHMNSFLDKNVRGAMTYYRVGDDSSRLCADLIQKALSESCAAKNAVSKVGDYYILNESYYTSVLVECGFISNAEEEALLNSKDYKNKVVDAIYKGVLLYLGNGII